MANPNIQHSRGAPTLLHGDLKLGAAAAPCHLLAQPRRQPSHTHIFCPTSPSVYTSCLLTTLNLWIPTCTYTLSLSHLYSHTPYTHAPTQAVTHIHSHTLNTFTCDTYIHVPSRTNTRMALTPLRVHPGKSQENEASTAGGCST